MAITSPTTLPSGARNPANEMLAENLKAIPGVRVSSCVSRPLGELIYEVVVDDGNIAAEMAVYRAEQDVYQRFPEARIQLYVV